jgi:hypothetical protein
MNTGEQGLKDHLAFIETLCTIARRWPAEDDPDRLLTESMTDGELIELAASFADETLSAFFSKLHTKLKES